jgi:multidrug efflux pump subunit AcrA (membrane-fusion protein)
VTALKEGQEANVTFQEYPGRKFKGSVYRLAGALDTATRTLQAEIHIDNRNGTLLPGMYASVSFASSGRTSIHIPSNTLIVNSSGTRVATVTQKHLVHFVPVLIGRDFGTELEITEGLKGNEILISAPGDDLREGQMVAASPAPAPPK